MKTSAGFYILISILFSGCVTVNLGEGKSQKADGVELKAPAKPFESQSRDDVDSAWKNRSNGNVISYLSDCKDPSDPPLDSIVQGVLSGLSEMKIETSAKPTVQGREARRTTAQGKVDGVPTHVELLVFKRNNCIFILNYAGVSSAFPDNKADFQRFVEGFKAP